MGWDDLTDSLNDGSSYWCPLKDSITLQCCSCRMVDSALQTCLGCLRWMGPACSEGFGRILSAWIGWPIANQNRDIRKFRTRSHVYRFGLHLSDDPYEAGPCSHRCLINSRFIFGPAHCLLKVRWPKATIDIFLRFSSRSILSLMMWNSLWDCAHCPERKIFDSETKCPHCGLPKP